MTDTPDTAPAIKPGYATTEGWLTFILALIGAAPSTLGTNAPQFVQVVGLIGAFITTIAYQWHRTKVKTAGTPIAGQLLMTQGEPISAFAPVAPEQPKGFIRPGLLVVIALLGAATVTIVACNHQERAAMSGEFKACAQADLGTLMPTGVTLAKGVASKIKGNAPTLESDLDDAAVTAGIDAVKCAIAAAEAVLLAPSGSGAAAGLPAGLVRAQKWAASK